MKIDEILECARRKAVECGLQWVVRLVQRDLWHALSTASEIQRAGHSKIVIYEAAVEGDSGIVLDVFVQPVEMQS